MNTHLWVLWIFVGPPKSAISYPSMVHESPLWDQAAQQPLPLGVTRPLVLSQKFHQLRSTLRGRWDWYTYRIHGAGIYANIGGILMVNVTIYNIHGSYGIEVNGNSMNTLVESCWVTGNSWCLRKMTNTFISQIEFHVAFQTARPSGSIWFHLVKCKPHDSTIR